MEDYNVPTDDFMDVFFDFDFDDFDANDLSVVGPEITPDAPLNKAKSRPVIVKSAKNNGGVKRKPGRPKSKKVLSDNSSEDQSTQSKVPNAKMYVFPVFDKCDSTLFLPTSLSKHLNSGDMKAVSNLLYTRLDKNCAISFLSFAPGQINVRYLIKAFEIISELHPDMIACASNTTVSENVIKASIHTKYTECKAIHDSVRQTITDPMFAKLRTADRVEELQHELERENRSEEEKQQFLAMAASGTDLLVYIHLELEMVIDDLTKKAYNTPTDPSDDDYMVIFDELGFIFDDEDQCLAELPVTTSPLPSSELDFNIGSHQASKITKKQKTTIARSSVSRRFNRAIKSSKQRSCAELVQRLTSGETMTLYAFPSFDRSDALIYLPTSLSRHMNAGDAKAVSRLLSSHLDENCTVMLSFFNLGQLNLKELIRAYEILQELHPDTIACSTNISVNENKIKASIYSKFTDCKIIQKSMRSTVTDPKFASVVHVERIDGVKHVQENRTDEEMEYFMEMAGSEQNLLIYMHLELEMTVDDFTKKVTEYCVSGRVTSIQPVDDSGIVL